MLPLSVSLAAVITLAVTIPVYLVGSSSGIVPGGASTMLLKGHVTMELNGEVVAEFDNIIVNDGFAAIGHRVSDPDYVGDVFNYIAVGSGTTDPVVGDTALEAEIVRVEGEYTENTVNEWQIEATFIPGVGTGAITESGVLNAAAAGTLLSRQEFPVVHKEAGDTLVVTWKYTLSQA